MRFCTRNAPISGAHAPTTTPGDERELHVLAVERPGHQARAPVLQPERQVLGVDAEAHAARGEVGRRPVEQHRALQHDDPVEVVGDRAELVRHQQHRRAVLGREVHERVAEQSLRLRVDAGDRLVEHEQLGIADERLGDEHALLLAAGELAHAAAAQVAERDRLEGVVDGVAVRGAGPAPPPAPGQAAGARRPPRPWPGGPAASRGRCGT